MVFYFYRSYTDFNELVTSSIPILVSLTKYNLVCLVITFWKIENIFFHVFIVFHVFIDTYLYHLHIDFILLFCDLHLRTFPCENR